MMRFRPVGTSNAVLMVSFLVSLTGILTSNAFRPTSLPSSLPWKYVPQRLRLLSTRGGEDVAVTTGNEIKFYSLEGGMCPYAARTWITLIELGLPFDLIEVNARKKEKWFLDINPRGKVPAIQNINDGALIYESAICDEYLCDYARQLENGASPTDQNIWKLVPVDAAEKASMRLLNDHIDTQLGPAQYTYLMNEETEKDAELIETLEQALCTLEDALEARGGPYLMGKDFTLADVHLLPFFLRLIVSLKHFKDYEIPGAKFARLLEWYALCCTRESVKAAAKSDEKIIEVYQRFVDVKYSFGGLNKNK